jgi:phosphatidate cytidylyltransferase
MLNMIHSLEPVRRMALIVFALLLLASVAILILRWVNPHRDWRELSARVRSWWIMAVLFFAAVALTPRVSIAFFGFVSFWAMKEYITLLKTRAADHGGLVWIFLSIPVQYYWVAADWYGMFIVFIPVYVFLFLPMRLVMAKETTGFIASVSQMQWGLMAFVFGLSHLAFLRGLPALPGTQASGSTLVLFLVFVTEMSDVLQYVWGKTLGRHKVIPAVSPNKTWEGLVGGILSTMLLSLAIRFLTPFSIPETLLVSLIITVAGFCGGAVMSAVKRDFGVKDFGDVIPGHGGVLDRVDSLCYAAPIFFHYVRYFYY